MGNQFPQAQHAEGQILGGNQGILIKERGLHASKSHIHNCRTPLDVLLELRVLRRNGLVADETLLGVADDLYIDPGPHPELFQDNLAVSGLPHGAGGISPVLLHLVLFHDPYKVL